MIPDPVPRDIRCPVCANISCGLIETIDISEQFKLYAPNNEEIYKKLIETCNLGFEAYHIYECNKCHLHFASPLKEPSPAWYSYAYNELNFHASSRWEFDYVINKLGRGERVGEIGCGTGIFLEKCASKGVDAYGVDFSEASVRECRRKGLRADVIRVDTADKETTNDKTVIVSFHVLEHLAEPAQLFKLASRWAAAESSLWIAVPSNQRIDRLTGGKDYLDEPPHHLTKWTPEALRLLGQQNGWSIRRTIYEPMSLRQRLWNICVTSELYKKTIRRTDVNNRRKERILRYALYPLCVAAHGKAITQLSGFSMLAEYRKSTGVAG